MAYLNLIVASAVLMAVGVFSSNSPIRVAPSMYVSPVQEGEQSSINVVNGFRSCGGQGKLIEFRYEACQPDQEICQVPGDGQRRKSELEFIPSQDISGLGVRFNVISDGEAINAYEREISDSSVQGGQKYIVHSDGGASDKLKGQTIQIQYILYRVEDNIVEICAEAEVQIV